MSKPKVSPIQSRAASVEVLRVDEQPVFRAALSSEKPAEKLFGTEVLVHSDEAIDMSRAAEGLPLTVGHSEMDMTSPALPVGRIQNITLEGDRKLRGDLVFDTDDRSVEVRGKVERGFAPDLSISYRILDFDGPDSDDVVTVTRWMPVAASIVSVPADGSVGVGRGMEGETEAAMSNDSKPEAGGAASILDTLKTKASAGYAQGAAAEGERQNAIRGRAAMIARSYPHLEPQIDALVEWATSDTSITAEQFDGHLLEQVGGAGYPNVPGDGARSVANGKVPIGGPSAALSAPAPIARPVAPQIPGNQSRGLVAPGEDRRELVARGIELAFLERAGVKVDREAMEGNRFRGWPMTDMQREILEAHGTDCRGMSRKQIAQAAMQMRAISPGTPAYQTSDFQAVTENVITKRVNDAFEAAETTWAQWCSTIEVPDFKQFTIPRLSQINSLPVVLEAAQYVNLTQVDEKEAATLVKRGGLISWSWEAMVNDDMGMFLRTADRLGEAAARTLDENAYGVLTTNSNMNDGNALFSAPHGNTGTNALDFDGIVATRTRMARQTDDNGELLGVVMRYVIVPEELRETANQLAGAEYLPTFREVSGTSETGVGGAQRVNTLRSTFEVVATVRLTDVTDWYAQGRVGQGVEIAFLAGNRNPVVERDSGWDIDSMHFKVRHPSVAYPIDWRGLQRNVVAG